MYTLQNCVVYPLIFQELSANDSTVQAESAAHNSGIVDDADTRSVVYNTTYSYFSDLCSLSPFPIAHWNLTSDCYTEEACRTLFSPLWLKLNG